MVRIHAKTRSLYYHLCQFPIPQVILKGWYIQTSEKSLPWHRRFEIVKFLLLSIWKNHHRVLNPLWLHQINKKDLAMRIMEWLNEENVALELFYKQSERWVKKKNSGRNMFKRKMFTVSHVTWFEILKKNIRSY